MAKDVTRLNEEKKSDRLAPHLLPFSPMWECWRVDRCLEDLAPPLDQMSQTAVSPPQRGPPGQKRPAVDRRTIRVLSAKPAGRP